MVVLILAALTLLISAGCQAGRPIPATGPEKRQGDAPVTMLPEETAPPAPGLDQTLLTLTPDPIVTPPDMPTPPATRQPAPARKPAESGTAPVAVAEQPATPVPIGPCKERMPTADLLAIVTLTYGLSRDFEPLDLVPLANYLPYNVTLGYPSELRKVAAEPLTHMIDDMIAAGLQPQVMSGYRSYAAQAIAWNKWNKLYPEHASIISAPPGFSEHQLGTVVDFGSPELPGIVGDPTIQFHTYFYKTSEGQWLWENAHKYGFTLSYTEEAFETTGFYYEPWHYRYVGEEMAAKLREQGITLTEMQLADAAAPCIP